MFCADLLINKFISDDIQQVIEIEGGYSNHPGDVGGATMYGISSKFNPSVASKIKQGTFTKCDAAKIYYEKYYKPSFAEAILDMPFTRYLIFDARVHGNKVVLRQLQHYLNKKGAGIIADGVVGPKTIRAIRKLVKDEDVLKWYTGNYESIMKEVAALTMNTQARMGKQVTDFTKGFTNRGRKILNGYST